MIQVPRYLRKVWKVLRKEGWTVNRRGSGHFQLKPPMAGVPSVTVPCTPGEKRSFKNCLADIRRSQRQMGVQSSL